MKSRVVLCFFLAFFAYIKFVSGQNCIDLGFTEISNISSNYFELTMTMSEDNQGQPYLYLAAANAGLFIYDISESQNPEFISQVETTNWENLSVTHLHQEGAHGYFQLGFRALFYTNWKLYS